MIFGLMLGRDGSKGLPGKNTMNVLGKPLMVYPLLAAQKSKYVEDVYISTDSEAIRDIGQKYGAKHIARPAELCTQEALGEEAFRHGYHWVKEAVGVDIEFVVLLFCNTATVTPELIDQGIEILRKNPEIDSAVSVSRYNMWSPLRARKEDENGLLQPFVPFETFGDPSTLNCDRDSQGDVWFADMGVSVVRPHCLENLQDGLLPQKWMGQKIYPLKQWGGCDIDYDWQVAGLEFWLKKHNLG